MTQPLYDDLEQRGLVAQVTSAPEVRAALAERKVTGYIGFDPTAASLHVGSLLPLTVLVRLQRAGHRPIALIGGGTGLIGDPSGKDAERSMLTNDVIEQNIAGVRAQLERFLDFSGERGALLVNNHDWLKRLDLIGFLRDIGKHFSVNAMIARDSVRLRLEAREHGISFTEFSYMLLQAYDFLALYDAHGCTLQMGGSDQWGNIVSGCDLIRRLRGVDAFGLTLPLVTRADGKKFGKSELGNVWLDAALTSPYAFYQFWLNTTDADVVRLIKMFTFLSMGDIDAIAAETEKAPEKREAQRVLAQAMTELVHGKAQAESAARTSAVLFDEQGDFRRLSEDELKSAFAGSPTTEVDRGKLGTKAAELIALAAESGLCGSRSEARRAVEQGAVYVNGRRVADVAYAIGEGDLLAGGFVILRRGKKTYHMLRFREGATLTAPSEGAR
jgi:tyrosyl-tRNA synthetase